MNLLLKLIDAGLTLETNGTDLAVSPAKLITEKLRELIVANKPAIWSDVRAAEELATSLIASINRCCDARGDDDHNRANLIHESGNFSPHQMADLIEHFDEQTAIWHLTTGKTYP